MFGLFESRRLRIQEGAHRLRGRFILFFSTYQASSRLQQKPLRVLVDSNVLRHGITHETAWIPIKTEATEYWDADGGAGHLARVPVHSPSKDSRIYREICSLTAISHLARLGSLELCTSAELQAEQWRHPAGKFSGYGCYDLSLFKNIAMKSLDGFHLDLKNPQDTQLSRVASCNDPLYLSLLSTLGQKNSLDAYHIFTAERLGLDCFLHIDFKLANKVAQNRAKEPFVNLKTKILVPSEFAKMVGLRPIAPNLISYEDSDFPVRPDLHLTNERRTRKKNRSERPSEG
jgi:hypothetical protein